MLNTTYATAKVPSTVVVAKSPMVTPMSSPPGFSRSRAAIAFDNSIPCTGTPRCASGSAIRPVPIPSSSACSLPASSDKKADRRIDHRWIEKLRGASSYPRGDTPVEVPILLHWANLPPTDLLSGIDADGIASKLRPRTDEEEVEERRVRRRLRLRGGSVSAYVGPAVYTLLSLPELSAADRKCLRYQRADRGRPRRTACRRAAARLLPRSGGKKQRIFRCPTCQVAVFSRYTRAGIRFVRGGTLDDPSSVTPDVHIYTRSKLSWVTASGPGPWCSRPTTTRRSSGPPPVSSASRRSGLRRKSRPRFTSDRPALGARQHPARATRPGPPVRPARPWSWRG